MFRMNSILRRKPVFPSLLNHARAGAFCSTHTPSPYISIHQDEKTQSLHFDLPARTESESKSKSSLRISSMQKNMTVKDLIQHIQDSDSTLETVQMIHHSKKSGGGGAVLAQSTKINTLVPGSFDIQLNDQTFRTTRSRRRYNDDIASALSTEEEDNDNDNFVSSYQHLKHHLLSRSNRQMNMEDYFNLCQTLFGTTPKHDQYASAWLEKLEQDQLILRWHRHDDRPLILLVPPSPSRQRKTMIMEKDTTKIIQDLEQALLGQSQELHDRIQNLQNDERKVTQNIESQLRRLTWLGFAGLNAQFGGLAYLVWDVHSWDVMEPITFFIGFAYAIGASVYFSMTKQDANYSNLYRRSFARRFRHAMSSGALNSKHSNSKNETLSYDDEATTRLKEQARALERQLEWIQYVSTNLDVWAMTNAWSGTLEHGATDVLVL